MYGHISLLRILFLNIIIVEHFASDDNKSNLTAFKATQFIAHNL